MSTYQNRYGRNRKERAERMLNNRAPAGVELPPSGYIHSALWDAYFPTQSRYIEDIFMLTKREMENRQFIVVRSQKYNELLRSGRRNKKYYFIHFKDDKSLFDVLYGTFSLGDCTCRDTEKCKHKLAVMKKYVKSPLRRLIF